MVVGERQCAKTHLGESIKDNRLAAPENEPSEASPMISKDRALEICEGKICLSEDILTALNSAASICRMSCLMRD